MASEDEIMPGPGGEEPSETYEYVEEIVEYKDNRGLRTLLAVILVILIFLIAGVGYLLWDSSRVQGGPSAAVKAGKMVWVRSIYGWGPGQDQQLSAPTAVATGPDGTIWSNSGNRIAVSFHSNGTFDRIIKSSEQTASSQATTGSATAKGAHLGAATKTKPKARATGVTAIFSLDVDSNNNLYIGDDAEGNALKFTPEGKLVEGWSIPGLSKIAASDSHVAVLGKANLGVFNQGTGAPVFSFGTRGQGVNQFDLPAGVHIDEAGFVYVADTQNRRVRKFTPSGRLIWDVGTLPDRKFETHVEASTGEFQLPTGVTTDANGRVVVTDAFNYNLTVLDGETGKKIASYGEYGQADGQFENPSAISYDPVRDYFVVADTTNNRLQVVRLPGSAKLTPSNLVNRAFQNPIWVLCCPFLILLVALAVSYALSRRRRREEDAAAASVAQAGEA